jgi:HEAT repeat protein
MRRLTSSFAAFTLVVVVPGLASVAFAHGGGYRGPPGEIPPDTREPTDPPPPPEGSPPSTPGSDNPGGPTTGSGDGSGGPVTPSGPGTSGPGTPSSGPSGPGGGPNGNPTTSGRGPGAKKAPGFSGWGYWWVNNKDEILQVKSAVNTMLRGSVTSDSFGKKSHGAIRRITDRAITEEIVPTLRALLADEKQSFHVRSAAELGLAKIGDEDSIETLRRMATNETKSFHREIEETAALALGLMQRDDRDTRDLLTDIVSRQARDGTYVRPFAAISLGLIGDKNDRERAVMSAFVAVVAHKEPGADIKPACLTGLGLLGNDAAIPELVAMVRNGKASAPGAVELTEIESAYAVAAIGKIGKPGTAKPGEETVALDEILRIVEKDKSKSGSNVRRSAAIALGQIGPQCAPKSARKVVDVLKRLVDENAEEQEKNFAVMSLARIGAAKGVDPATRKELVAFLGRVMDRAHGQTPAFAAMALGLVGRGMCDEGDAAPEEEIRAPLRAKFDAGGEPQTRGAFALASGLVRDPLAADHLLKTLNDRNADKRVRGWCALALGLIGDRTATEAIRTTLKDDADRDLRVQAAIAAGLLQDPSVIGDVTGVLSDKESSNYELGSAALALGQIGDERAITALVDIAKDTTNRYPDLTRALAVVALGQIGDRRDVPVLARVATDVNYRAHVPAITELLTIL